MSTEQRRFVARRVKLVRAWPVVGGLLLCLTVALGVWLFLSRPLLANPLAVLSGLNSDSIPPSTLALMAGLLPVAVLLCLVLVVVTILFAFASFANEKKYLSIIHRMGETPRDPPHGGPDQAGRTQPCAAADAARGGADR